MAGIFESIPFIGGGSGIGLVNILMWTLIFVLIFGSITITFIMILVAKTNTKFIELNLVNKKVDFFNGRMKKSKNSKIRHMWIRKLKKYLPAIQQNDIYIKKNQDTIILVKDRNGLHHTARLPTYNEIKKWYRVIYDIDLDNESEREKHIKQCEALKTIYLLPNPTEDLDWLGDQVAEANIEFADIWWKHPNVVLIGAFALSAFVFVITLIISKKM